MEGGREGKTADRVAEESILTGRREEDRGDTLTSSVIRRRHMNLRGGVLEV